MEAKWLDSNTETTFKCSNCGNEPMYIPRNGKVWIGLSDYCPYCGAHMTYEGDDEEEEVKL